MRGQTVRFLVRNSGRLPHETVLGTKSELHKHVTLMKRGGRVLFRLSYSGALRRRDVRSDHRYTFTRERKQVMSTKAIAVLALGAIVGLGPLTQAAAQQGGMGSGMGQGSMGQGGMGQSTGQPSMMQMQADALADGEVRKVDKDAGKLTIKHGPIPRMDMPPMTMVYRVKEPAMLDAVKPGDKVKFRAEQEGGQYFVTRIEPVK